MSTTTSRTFTRALASSGALLIAASVISVSAPQAQAAGAATTTSATTAEAMTPTAVPTTAQKAQAKRVAFANRVLKVVSSRRGSPYVYGASGPHRFDCSGLTMWTFQRVGDRLPHSAAAQYGRTRHIRAADRRPGDLVFFHDGGGIYHVGIYAGHNQIWHAPFSGQRVRKERLWTRSVYYGRLS